MSSCEFAVVVEYQKVVCDFKTVDFDPKGPKNLVTVKKLLHSLQPCTGVRCCGCRRLLQNGSKRSSTPRHEVSFQFAVHYRKMVRKISLSESRA